MTIPRLCFAVSRYIPNPFTPFLSSSSCRSYSRRRYHFLLGRHLLLTSEPSQIGEAHLVPLSTDDWPELRARPNPSLKFNAQSEGLPSPAWGFAKSAAVSIGHRRRSLLPVSAFDPFVIQAILASLDKSEPSLTQAHVAC